MDRATNKAWLTDMDGVLVHEGKALPGAAEFIGRLIERERPFLVLTNNSIYTPRDLAARLQRAGLEVPEDRIWTSAMATAQFLAGGDPFVIDDPTGYEDALLFGFGLGMSNDLFALYFSYDGESAGDAMTHRGGVNFRLRF